MFFLSLVIINFLKFYIKFDIFKKKFSYNKILKFMKNIGYYNLKVYNLKKNIKIGKKFMKHFNRQRVFFLSLILLKF